MPRRYVYPRGKGSDSRTFPGFQIVAVQPKDEVREMVVAVFIPTMKEARLFREGYNAATGGGDTLGWAEIRPVEVPSLAKNPRGKRGAK